MLNFFQNSLIVITAKGPNTVSGGEVVAKAVGGAEMDGVRGASGLRPAAATRHATSIGGSEQCSHKFRIRILHTEVENSQNWTKILK